MKVAFLFPGQGSQKAGMGKELADNFSAAKSTFAEADDALGFSISTLCFEGPEDDLQLTANSQPAILATSIAAFRAFSTELNIQPAVAAGHSLGEYSALVAAGSLSFTDAIKAVRERGRLMQSACAPGIGSMAAVMGLEQDAVEKVCQQSSNAGEIVVAANLNCPGQIVIAGHKPAVDRALKAAEEAGSRGSVELKVSAPFHSPLMRPARDGMAAVLEKISVAPPRFDVISNVTAQIHGDTAKIVPLLLEQITAPVRWHDSMKLLDSLGIQTAVEFGGRVLAGLQRRINRSVKVSSIEDRASLEAAVAALHSTQS